MCNYNTLSKKFLQYKNFCGYSYKSDSIILKEIVNFLEENNIKEITKQTVEKYARLNPNIKQNTLVRNMVVFKEFNKYLKLQGIDCYQIPNKVYAKKDKDFVAYTFTYDEIKQIYNSLKNFTYDYHYSYYNQLSYPLIIKILYQTGIRIGELLNIKVMDYNGELFILRKTKNNQERTIMIPESLKKDLLKFHNKFHNDSKELFFKNSSNSVGTFFKKILRMSKIKITDNGPRLHDLRHTFIVHSIERMRKSGKDLKICLPVLQSHVGHQSLESLSYYFHMNNDILHELKNVSERKLSYLIPEMIDGDDYE